MRRQGENYWVAAIPDLPSEVDNFTGPCQLEPPPPSPLHKSFTFGYVTTVYKTVNIIFVPPVSIRDRVCTCSG